MTTASKPMTIEEILAAEEADRIAFEAKTVGARVGDHEYTIAELRKVFNAVANQEDWKTPWAASVPSVLVPIVMAAVEFYHADRPTLDGIEPITGKVLMSGHGYQG